MHKLVLYTTIYKRMVETEKRPSLGKVVKWILYSLQIQLENKEKHEELHEVTVNLKNHVIQSKIISIWVTITYTVTHIYQGLIENMKKFDVLEWSDKDDFVP